MVFDVYNLTEEVKNWWDGVRGRLEAEGAIITWAVFQERFLEKYFPEDACEKHEMEFLALTQGSMLVGNYATKFEELCYYHPYYHNAVNDRP